jgi:hypothetical protein
LAGLALEAVGIFYGHLVYFTSIWYIFGHLVYFVVIRYIFSRFGMLYQEKSGNPTYTGCESFCTAVDVSFDRKLNTTYVCNCSKMFNQHRLPVHLPSQRLILAETVAKSSIKTTKRILILSPMFC